MRFYMWMDTIMNQVVSQKLLFRPDNNNKIYVSSKYSVCLSSTGRVGFVQSVESTNQIALVPACLELLPSNTD